MKKTLLALALGVSATLPALAQVGVTIGVNQPGVYGQVTIGDYGPPTLVYDQPVIVTRGARYAAPVYMYVPAAEQRDWGRYCGRYDACGHPVYFVREDWVRDRWEHDRGRRERGWRDDDRHDHRGWRDSDHRGWRDDDDRGGRWNHGDRYEPWHDR